MISKKIMKKKIEEKKNIFIRVSVISVTTTTICFRFSSNNNSCRCKKAEEHQCDNKWSRALLLVCNK